MAATDNVDWEIKELPLVLNPHDVKPLDVKALSSKAMHRWLKRNVSYV